MSVFKPTGTKTFTYSFQLGGRRFHGSTGKTEKRAAKEVERQARAAALRQIEADKKTQAQISGDAPLTFDVAAGRFWKEVGEHHAGAATTWTDLERLLKYLGPSRRLDSLTDNDVTLLVAWRRGHRVKDRAKLPSGQPAPCIAPATVNRTTIDLLRKIYTRARTKWGQRFDHEPDWKAHRLKERGEVVRELKASEENDLQKVLPEGYRDLWRFALASGLRLAECFIKWDQIDWQTRTITVTQKGGRPHSIPLSQEMIAIISPQRGRHPIWVFTYVCVRSSKNRRKGERYQVTYEGMKTAWRRNKGKAGADDMRFHDNRHNFSIRLLRRTGNLKAVQRMLGHADITTTARFYAHVDMDDLRALLDAPGSTHPQGFPQGLGAEAEADKPSEGEKVSNSKPFRAVGA